MGLTLAQLTTPLTVAQATQQVLDALQGRGVVLKSGTGTGSATIAGTPAASYSVVLKIIASGELAAATYQVSTDGGVTFGGTVTTPANGQIAISTSGVTVTLARGPVGSGTSFVAGDTYSFSLAAPNLPASSWQSGSVIRNLVQAYAQGQASLSQLVASVTAGGLLYTATGSWLDLLATNLYALTRNAAIATQISATLTDAASAGPFTIAAGQLWVASTGGLRFNNVGGGTLTKGGTLTLTFQAESPGAAYNVGDNAITTMVTPLPGVTVNNPGPNSTTTSGTDAESDAALQTRCAARWPSLGYGATAAVYQLWATTAAPAVTRALVIQDPSIAGQVDIYCAGSTGPSPGGDVTTVQTYVNARAPLTAGVLVAAAVAHVITISGTVYVLAANLAAATIAVANNLAAYFATIPIGGTVYLSTIYEEIMLPTGVQHVSLSAPTGDVALAATEVATLTNSLTFTGV